MPSIEELAFRTSGRPDPLPLRMDLCGVQSAAGIPDRVSVEVEEPHGNRIREDPSSVPGSCFELAKGVWSEIHAVEERMIGIERKTPREWLERAWTDRVRCGV